MKAILKNAKSGPKKIGLVARLIRGKTVKNAIGILKFTSKRKCGGILLKLLNSAVANAMNKGIRNTDEMIVKKIEIGRGMSFKRIMFRGRAGVDFVKTRMTNVSMFLDGGIETLEQKIEDSEEKKEEING